MKPYHERKQTEEQEDESKALNPQSKPETLIALYEKYKNKPSRTYYMFYSLFENPSLPIELLKNFINQDHKILSKDWASNRVLFGVILRAQNERLTKKELNKVSNYVGWSYKYFNAAARLSKIIEELKDRK